MRDELCLRSYTQRKAALNEERPALQRKKEGKKPGSVVAGRGNWLGLEAQKVDGELRLLNEAHGEPSPDAGDAIGARRC